MDTADDIAYAIHDLEDVHRVGVLQQGAVAAELMAWQRHGRETEQGRPGSAIESLRRQLHRKDSWMADDDAFAAAVELVRAELVDGLLALPFDGSLEAEAQVAAFSATWSRRLGKSDCAPSTKPVRLWQRRLQRCNHVISATTGGSHAFSSCPCRGPH